MVDIERIRSEIVERLMPLQPDKIILFGSYAYGEPHEESDIDLFIINDAPKEEVRQYDLSAMKNLRDLIFKYKIGFDVLSDSRSRIDYRINDLNDYFYKDIIEKGKILWETKL